MSWLTQTWRSSIGGKQVVAITGLALVGFLIAHMVGNLQVFAGKQVLNDYAQMLKGLGPLLWVMRIGLLAVFVLHVVTAVRLTTANRDARPFPYAHENTVQASFASRYMIWTGVLVLLFVVYHLAHFTLGVTNPSHYAMEQPIGDGSVRHDVYSMVVLGFSDPLIVLIYVAAQGVLFFHLVHGISSVFQTMGFCHARYTPLVDVVGKGLAAVIAGGNILIALGVFLGFAPEYPDALS